MANIYGRQVVQPKTNKSGGGVIAGDVVIIDTGNDDAFTTTTTSQYGGSVGVAQETIANNASGRILTAGYAALINVPSSVTRGHYIETHTVVKQATGNSTRRAGSFGQFTTGGTTPKGWMWGFPDNQGAAGGITHTTVGTTSVGASFTGTARGTFLQKVTLATAGFMANVNVHVKGDGTNNAGSMAMVYTDSSGPTNILSAAGFATTTGGAGNRNVILNTTARWMQWPLGMWLASGDYWIGIWLDSGGTNGLQIAFDSGTGSDYTRTIGSGIPQDSSVSSLTSGTNKHSIYADILR